MHVGVIHARHCDQTVYAKIKSILDSGNVPVYYKQAHQKIIVH